VPLRRCEDNGAHKFIPFHDGYKPIHGARREAGIGLAQNATNICEGAKNSVLIVSVHNAN
jgi:uncharacterized heparinase superfamily protein